MSDRHPSGHAILRKCRIQEKHFIGMLLGSGTRIRRTEHYGTRAPSAD
jgi:hypothetical protein